MKRAKDATLVLCLFVVYCVLLSQGLKASAVSTFFGSLAAVPLTLHVYRRLWPLPLESGVREEPARLSDVGGEPTMEAKPHDNGRGSCRSTT
jgi:hypothetical protein